MADPKKGTGKKPKGTGRRLYTDENPRDTVKIKLQHQQMQERLLQKSNVLTNRLQGKYKY